MLRPLPFSGVYINLERSKKRRAHIDAQLRKFGLQGHYQRFAAVDGRELQQGASRMRTGEVATLMSHIDALRHMTRYKKPAHVLEDDTVLSNHVAPVIAQGIFDDYDMVYTDIIVVPDPDIVSFAGVVGQTAFETVRRPADFSIVNLNTQIREGAIRAACIIPFITSVHPEYSQNPEVSGRQAQPADKLLAIDLLRRLFFVDSRLDGTVSGLLERLVGKRHPVTRVRTISARSSKD